MARFATSISPTNLATHGPGRGATGPDCVKKPGPDTGPVLPYLQWLLFCVPVACGAAAVFLRYRRTDRRPRKEYVGPWCVVNRRFCSRHTAAALVEGFTLDLARIQVSLSQEAPITLCLSA